MSLTQQQIDVQNYNIRNKHVKIELLDYDLLPIETIEGTVVDGNFSANAENAIRYTGNITMAIPTFVSTDSLTDSTYTISAGGKIWLDKRVKIFVGIEDLATGDIVWQCLGIYYIDKPVRTFSGTTYTISFECADQMIKLTGDRQGQLTGQTTVISMGETITSGGTTTYVKTKTFDALKTVIEELAGISKYVIYPIPQKYEYLPYDLKFGVGATVYDILSQIMDTLATWQMYFRREDGVFVIEPIPDGKNDIVYNINELQLLENSQNVEFNNVKNQVVVYGRLNTLTYYTDTATYNSATNTLTLTFDAVDSTKWTVNGTLFGFKSPTQINPLLTQVAIYQGSTLIKLASLCDFEVPLSSVQSGTIPPNEIVCLRIYSASLNSSGQIDLTSSVVLEYYGKQQASACLVDDNIESPYYVNTHINGTNYYCGTSSSVDGTSYTLTLNNTRTITSLADGAILTFMANQTNVASCTISVTDNLHVALTNAQNAPLYYNGSAITAGKISNDYTIWMIQYDSTNNRFNLLGRNPYVLTQVFSGGEYDNIYADQLAYERALWELYQHSNTQNTVSLGIVPSYILDVNCKIPYYESFTSPEENVVTSEDFYTILGSDFEPFLVKDAVGSSNYEPTIVNKTTQYYLIKQINYPLGVSNAAQNLTAMQIYDSGNLVGDN